MVNFLIYTLYNCWLFIHFAAEQLASRTKQNAWLIEQVYSCLCALKHSEQPILPLKTCVLQDEMIEKFNQNIFFYLIK